jgi:hypothetical protein
VEPKFEVRMVERGGPPPRFTEQELCEWIAHRQGVPAAEVRAARRQYREARGLTLSGDAELDRTRLAVEAALDAGSGRRPVPRQRTTKPVRARTKTTTTVPTTGTNAAARAAAYATTRRNP